MPTTTRRLRAAVAQAVAAADSLDATVVAIDDVLRSHVPADAAVWGSIDPACLLSTSCMVRGSLDAASPARAAARERRLFELEWADVAPNTFADLHRRGRAAAGLRLDVADVRRVDRFVELLEGAGVTDELRLLCRVGADAWATGILYRSEGPPFSATEVELAAAATGAIARASRRAMLVAAARTAHGPLPPGSMTVTTAGEIVTSSHAAEELLAGVDAAAVRATLAGLAARADALPSVRLAGADGVVVLHASPMKGADDLVGIVVERPRPIVLAPLIVEAYGLTPRERLAIELALHGASRDAIGRRLRISRDTVDQHLSAAYRKAGVGNRAELAARLFGSFYEVPRADGRAPGPYGWFLDGAAG